MRKRIGKFLKRLFLTLGIIFLLLFIFRGMIYESLVEYVGLDARRSYIITDDSLKAYIDSKLPDEKFSDIHIISAVSQSITSDVLSFSLTTKISDPNIIWKTRKANCMGYAAFTAAVMNYMIDQTYKERNWYAEPRRGLLMCGGINLNKLFHNKYFKDHDFVLIRNTESGTEIYIDPTVHDYLGVDEIKKYETD